MKRKVAYISYGFGVIASLAIAGVPQAWAADYTSGQGGLIMIPYQAQDNRPLPPSPSEWRRTLPDSTIASRPPIQNTPSMPPVIRVPTPVPVPVTVPVPQQAVVPPAQPIRLQPRHEPAPIVPAAPLVAEPRVPEHLPPRVVTSTPVPAPIPETVIAARPAVTVPLPAPSVPEASPPARVPRTRAISSAPAEPVSTAPTRGVGMWHAAQHQTLDQVLADWGDRAGWKVVYNSRMIYELQAGADFEGDFIQASTALIKSIRANPQPLATFYKGNKALVITNSENQIN